MNERQQSAIKPAHLRANALNTKSSLVSPALSGATFAFSPKQNPAVAVDALQSASTSIAGATSAARAACINPDTPTSLVTSLNGEQRNGASPERGRIIHLSRNNSSLPGGHVVLPPAKSSPTWSGQLVRSPSTIAAVHASSQSTSPSRSPNRSPHRRSKAIATAQNNQVLPDDLSKALAGAVRSMATATKDIEHPTVPVRSRALNFEKIPTLAKSSPSSALNDALKNKSAVGQSTLIPKSTLAVDVSVRDRAHSVGEEQPLRRQLSRHESESSNSIMQSPPSAVSRMSSNSSVYRPPVPPRQIHQPQKSNSLHQQHRDTRNYRGMTVNGLADAMVASSLASSLASSRAASPAKRPNPPAHRRRSRSFSSLYDLSAKQNVDLSRKPLNPPRPMKHTLRKQSETEDEELELVKRGRRHWMRKHPNKHHEGDRKRWRDKVTEKERKRYEGIFAANRGLLIGSGIFKPSASTLADNTFESNRVVNVIVREIWERSRLPRDILAEVYDLVAPAEDKSLGKEQFVVGMWLIDQRLKGRKLPVKVSSSVWSSVRHPDGIKLKGHHS